MARKYARDNRGRFASGGSGATARGGRLKTASGNKRATQTMRAAGAGGVIKGRTARTVAGQKVMAKMAKRAPAAKRINAARPGGTVAKPKGLKPGVITQRLAPGAGQAKVAPKAGKGGRIDDAKVSRVIGRVNSVVRGAEQKTGVKRLNATQVGVRAKSFLARKEGGNVGILNQKSQPEAFASVRKAMTRPPRYSTQKPNRNKPGRFNDLGQDRARAKAKADAMTARERIIKANESVVAKAKERRGKMTTGALSRRDLPQIGAPRLPGFVKGPRQAGTIAKPKAKTSPVSSTVVRTRTQAKSAQRNRREQVLDRGRTGVTGLGSMRKNPRIRKVQTGMSQLSLIGKAKPLVRFKPAGRRR